MGFVVAAQRGSGGTVLGALLGGVAPRRRPIVPCLPAISVPAGGRLPTPHPRAVAKRFGGYKREEKGKEGYEGDWVHGRQRVRGEDGERDGDSQLHEATLYRGSVGLRSTYVFMRMLMERREEAKSETRKGTETC